MIFYIRLNKDIDGAILLHKIQQMISTYQKNNDLSNVILSIELRNIACDIDPYIAKLEYKEIKNDRKNQMPEST